MSYRDELEDLTRDVNNAVRLYLSIEKDVTRENANLLSGKKPDDPDVTFAELLDLCQSLSHLWEDICRQVNDFGGSTEAALTIDEKVYLHALVLYVDSVKQGVTLLAARQKLVCEEQNSEKLIAKNAEYEESERHRQSLGKDFHALESFFVEDNENAMGSPEICEVHRVPLKRAKVRLLFGTPIHDEDFAALIAARSTFFPNSRTHFLGGCTLRREPRTETLVCLDCRHAEREWSETTGLPIEPKIGGMLIT